MAACWIWESSSQTYTMISLDLKQFAEMRNVQRNNYATKEVLCKNCFLVYEGFQKLKTGGGASHPHSSKHETHNFVRISRRRLKTCRCDRPRLRRSLQAHRAGQRSRWLVPRFSVFRQPHQYPSLRPLHPAAQRHLRQSASLGRLPQCSEILVMLQIAKKCPDCQGMKYLIWRHTPPHGVWLLCNECHKKRERATSPTREIALVQKS